jgi:N-acylneuraminate cytidylyltransferase
LKYLALIPARGGSKRIPRKNIKLLNGKPLIHYTIDVTRAVFLDADICVSTDSEEIKKVVERTGLSVPFLRPDSLATDKAGSYEVILHAIQHYENQEKFYDAVVLLQPTSPFRTVHHIKDALKLFSKKMDMLVSVKETNSNPYYNLFEEDEKGYLRKSKKGDFIRQQDCPKVYEYNGAIYVINIESLKEMALHQFEKINKYVMDEESSLDIDTPLDFLLTELILNKL